MLAALLLAGCGSGGFSERKAAGHRPNELRATLNANPTTLDPIIVQDVETTPVIKDVFEGLVSWDANNSIRGQLAEKWEISPDGRTYTFHLRKGVLFHNGRPLTADDVKFSLERSCDPSLNSPTALNYLGDIVGAADKLAGKVDRIAGVVAADPLTVRITIDKPRAYFIGKLTYPCAFVVAKEAVRPGKEISSVSEMIGTGPFKADSFEPEQQISLIANDAYYEGRPKLSRIEYLVMKDSMTRLDKFKAGEVDIAGVVRQDVPSLQKDPVLGPEVHLLQRPAVAYLAMNPAGYAPFADVRVRRALVMAIDRKAIADQILNGINPVAEGILPPGIAGHRDHPKGLPYDPAAAAKLLAQAGYPGGKGMPTLELVIRDQTPDTRVVAEALATQITQNLGIEVKLKTMEWRSMLTARNEKKLGFFILSWYADYLDPQNFLSTLLTTSGPGNKFNYSNPEVDRLCLEADTLQDANRRIRLYQQAEDLVLQDAPWAPLYFVRDAELVSPRVSGLRDNLMGNLPYTQVTVK